MLQVYSGVRVAYLILFLLCYFGYFMFFVVYDYFPCQVVISGLCSRFFQYLDFLLQSLYILILRYLDSLLQSRCIIKQDDVV